MLYELDNVTYRYERNAAIKDAVWALLASTEFCINH